MLALVVAALGLAGATAAPEVGVEVVPRIVGGHSVSIEDFPWQVSIRAFGQHHCGGSIISENFVLTAAHCVEMPYSYQVGAGSSFVSRVRIYDVIYKKVHERFNLPPYSNDVAVLQVSEEFHLGPRIQIVPLAVSRPRPGTPVTVTGWGATSEEGDVMKKLRSCTVEVIALRDCQKCYLEEPLTNDMLCAGVWQGGRDACQGDSGGPLVHDGEQVGVVSFGKGCGRPQQPGIYADVVTLRPWITRNADIA